MDIGETGHAQTGNSSTQDVDEFMRSSVEFSLTLSERSIHSSSSYVGLYPIAQSRIVRTNELHAGQGIASVNTKSLASYKTGLTHGCSWVRPQDSSRCGQAVGARPLRCPGRGSISRDSSCVGFITDALTHETRSARSSLSTWYHALYIVQ